MVLLSILSHPLKAKRCQGDSSPDIWIIVLTDERKARFMKKTVYLLSTAAIMLIVSRFIVRIVDATVQIDNDAGMLLLLLILVNAVIAFVSYKLYHASDRK